MSICAPTFWQWFLTSFFIIAGINHFVNPQPYLAMMPSYLPWHAALVWISGLAEIVGGLGILPSRTRRLAGWGLLTLLVAVFPANVNVALHGWPGVNVLVWVLWIRLPLQFLFLWWVYRVCISPPSLPSQKDVNEDSSSISTPDISA